MGLCEHISFVYSMKTNSWSEIQLPTTRPLYQVISEACFVDGVLHWLVEYVTNGITQHCIMTFNLSTHVFYMISLPEPTWLRNRLIFIKDSLAVFSYDGFEGRVWIRRKEDNKVASWSNALKLTSLKVEDLKGYNPFTGVHYAFVFHSKSCYTIDKVICGESLEFLDKETC